MPVQIEPRVSLGNILTAVLVVVGVVVSYTQLQEGVESNTKALEALRNVVAENRTFQIEQRVRVWDRVGELESKVTAMGNSIARLEAGQDFIIRQTEKISSKLDSLLERGGE